MSSRASEDRERPAAAAAKLGHPRLHTRETDSTNLRAHELALAGAPHGTLVTTSFQTAGRGRQGRRWVAPAGSALLMSLILRGEPDWLATLPLRAGVAVCDTAGPSALIKWPNDVVIARPPGPGGATDGVRTPERDRVPTPESQRRPPSPGLAKLAGILTEGRPQEGWAVLGIGINVAVELSDLPAEVRAVAATLGRSPQSIEPTLLQLLDALEERLAEPTESLLAAWQERDALLGREIAWGPAPRSEKGEAFAEGSGGRGRAEGINGAGHLLVGLAGGSHAALDAGEVRLLSPP